MMGGLSTTGSQTWRKLLWPCERETRSRDALRQKGIQSGNRDREQIDHRAAHDQNFNYAPITSGAVALVDWAKLFNSLGVALFNLLRRALHYVASQVNGNATSDDVEKKGFHGIGFL